MNRSAGPQNLGIKGIIERFYKSGFTEEEKMKSLLLYQLRAHHTLQLPATSTIQKYKLAPILKASPLSPTVLDISHDFESAFQDLAGLIEKGTMPDFVLMFDELKVEERSRLDTASGKVLGICREHGKAIALSINSYEELEQLVAAIDSKEVHLASERLYAARPIMISGTCKCEKADAHTELIETVIKVCKFMSEKLGLGHLVFITSDGEARRGQSFACLTLWKSILPDSPLFPLLSGMQLFNTLDSGISKTRIDCLLRPDDTQDVMLAVQLLQSVTKLPPPSEGTKPAYTKSRRALNLLGILINILLKPYIDISLSASEQLENLSAAAHLTLWLYLYGDIMLMLKNIYICFAKTKAKDSEGSFWLCLLGTDHLETSLGIVRTMVGNNANADTLQLSSRLSNAVTCANILAEHPEWDRTPCRLKLPVIDFASSNSSSRLDHISPGVWKGNVSVKNAHPLTCWRRACSLDLLTLLISTLKIWLALIMQNTLKECHHLT
ncbi:hypothetical protein BDV93DRAFT_534170 [Ceratobasidium sp. AG-I]|nr:hypothetical protein BDV93DRAFT_534170 [Ceratobasidium sp. AG-I]